MSIKRLLSATIFCNAALAMWPAMVIAAPDSSENDILKMSLQDLINVEVTSVSKKSEKANEAPAAIFVITQEDIKRLGATSIPEALRIVPGLNVARAGSHQWAVTSRGFNDQFANKLLVLIDGRSVYTPFFSGVWWDVQDTLLEDIDRIEVIRGPGSTLWGANAVNGVINIITKKAKDTEGALLTQAFGNHERSITAGRYGSQLGENAHMRVYAKYNERDEETLLSGGSANDQWHKEQAGFRTDWKPESIGGDLTLQGDVYNLRENILFSIPSFFSPPSLLTPTKQEASGGNLLARWSYPISETSDFTAQFYYDNAQREIPNVLNYTTDTLDFDAQHTFQFGERNEFVWGAGYRLIMNDSENTPLLFLTPKSRDDSLFSAFVQDKIMLLPKELYLTLGSKFEHNDYTGFEVQPNARLTWLIDDKQTFWTSIARAVRTPSWSVENGNVPLIAFPPGPMPLGFLSRVGADHDSEVLIAYEAGYRIQPKQNLSIDVATFYNDYSELIRGSLGMPFPSTNPLLPPHLVFPVLPLNDTNAKAYGVETAIAWNVRENWQLALNYTYQNLTFDKLDFGGFSFAGKSPKHQVNLRSHYDITTELAMDNILYYTEKLTSGNVPDYTRFDTQITWKPVKNLEFSLVGQNLLDEKHQEFSGFIYEAPIEIGRSIYGKATWKF